MPPSPLRRLLSPALEDPLASLGLLILRAGFGFTMLLHGIKKIENWDQLSGMFINFLGLGPKLSLTLATGAEVGCSCLLIVGLATRLALIPLIITMLTALTMVHLGDPWQKMEPAAVYLAVYLGLLATGPGRFSLDSVLTSPKRAPGDA